MVLQCFGPSPINLSIRDNRNRFFFPFWRKQISSSPLLFDGITDGTRSYRHYHYHRRHHHHHGYNTTTTTSIFHRFLRFYMFWFSRLFSRSIYFFSFIQGHILMWKLLRCRFSSLVHSQPLHSQYSGFRMYLHIFIGIKHW